MTEVPLQEYLEKCLSGLDDKLDAQSKHIEQHFKLNELAIKKAEEAMLTRLEAMNEFRTQINTERATYTTKEMFESRIRPLERANAFSAGKLWMVLAIFTAIPTILAIVALFKK